MYLKTNIKKDSENVNTNNYCYSENLLTRTSQKNN